MTTVKTPYDKPVYLLADVNCAQAAHSYHPAQDRLSTKILYISKVNM